MVTFLEKNVCKKKADLLKDKKKVPLQRLEMSWRDGTNKKDCGLYVMRHMETYYGNGMDGWETRIKPNDNEVFNVMRVRYCNTILESNWNEKKGNVSRLLTSVKRERKKT